MKTPIAFTIIKAILLLGAVATLIPMFTVGVESVDALLYCVYGYIGLAVLALLVLGLANLGKSSGGSYIGASVAVVLAAVAVASYYLLANDQPIELAKETITDGFILKGTDVMLYTSYASFALLILVVIVGEIRNSFK